MVQFDGLRVTVEGNLPADVMERLSAAARAAVMRELAELDTAPDLFEWPFDAGTDDDGFKIDAGGAIWKQDPPPDPFGGVVTDPLE